jgi:hypothetical protein
MEKRRKIKDSDREASQGWTESPWPPCITTQGHLSIQTLAPGSHWHLRLLLGISFPFQVSGFFSPYVANFPSFQSLPLHLKSECILFLASEFEGEITEVSRPFNIENKWAHNTMEECVCACEHTHSLLFPALIHFSAPLCKITGEAWAVPLKKVLHISLKKESHSQKLPFVVHQVCQADFN